MQRKSFAWPVALAGILISIAGSLAICWLEWRFYKGCSKLPPGTEIRPMGQAFVEVAVCFFTFVLAIPLSATGVFFGIKQHRLAVGILAVTGLVLAFVPWPLAHWLGQRTIAATGVILEP